jgi:hypothetical protein
MTSSTPKGPQHVRRTEVFISAATKDLKTSRAIAKLAVDSIGCHGDYQEEFSPDYRKVEDMLRARLSRCEVDPEIRASAEVMRLWWLQSG